MWSASSCCVYVPLVSVSDPESVPSMLIWNVLFVPSMTVEVASVLVAVMLACSAAWVMSIS